MENQKLKQPVCRNCIHAMKEENFLVFCKKLGYYKRAMFEGKKCELKMFKMKER